MQKWIPYKLIFFLKKSSSYGIQSSQIGNQRRYKNRFLISYFFSQENQAHMESILPKQKIRVSAKILIHTRERGGHCPPCLLMLNLERGMCPSQSPRAFHMACAHGTYQKKREHVPLWITSRGGVHPTRYFSKVQCQVKWVKEEGLRLGSNPYGRPKWCPLNPTRLG